MSKNAIDIINNRRKNYRLCHCHQKSTRKLLGISDLPGCITTGKTIEEIEINIKEAINFHLEGLKEEDLPLPQPTTKCQYVEA